jgi:hypothetical protein
VKTHTFTFSARLLRESKIGPEAAEDLQDVLDHAPKVLVPDLYRRIEARLQSRLNGQKAAAVA